MTRFGEQLAMFVDRGQRAQRAVDQIIKESGRQVGKTVEQLVRSTMKEYYDAMRSEASCRSTAKKITLTGAERFELLERAKSHRTRAENAILRLTRHVTYPEHAK